MHVGSNPTARTSQSQSPRSPYRGAGRLFCTRFAGSMASRRHQIMRYAVLPFPCLPVYPIAIYPAINLPAFRTVFPAPPHRRTLFDSPCRAPIRLGGTRRPRLSPRVPFTIGGENLSPAWLSFDSRSALAMLPASLFVQSASRLPPRFAFRRTTRRLLLSAYLYGRRGGCVFFARMSVFPVDSVAICDTLIDIHAGVVERQTRQI